MDHFFGPGPGEPISRTDLREMACGVNKLYDQFGFVGINVDGTQQTPILNVPKVDRVNARILGGSGPYAWESVIPSDLAGNWQSDGIYGGTVEVAPLVVRVPSGQVFAVGDVVEAVYQQNIGCWVCDAPAPPPTPTIPCEFIRAVTTEAGGADFGGGTNYSWNQIHDSFRRLYAHPFLGVASGGGQQINGPNASGGYTFIPPGGDITSYTLLVDGTNTPAIPKGPGVSPSDIASYLHTANPAITYTVTQMANGLGYYIVPSSASTISFVGFDAATGGGTPLSAGGTGHSSAVERNGHPVPIGTEVLLRRSTYRPGLRLVATKTQAGDGSTLRTEWAVKWVDYGYNTYHNGRDGTVVQGYAIASFDGVSITQVSPDGVSDSSEEGSFYQLVAPPMGTLAVGMTDGSGLPGSGLAAYLTANFPATFSGTGSAAHNTQVDSTNTAGGSTGGAYTITCTSDFNDHDLSFDSSYYVQDGAPYEFDYTEPLPDLGSVGPPLGLDPTLFTSAFGDDPIPLAEIFNKLAYAIVHGLTTI